MTDIKPISVDSLDLVGKLVSKNVDDLARTNALIESGLKKDIEDLARGLVAIERVFDQAVVIDRPTERKMMHMRVHFDRAHRILERMESSN